MKTFIVKPILHIDSEELDFEMREDIFGKGFDEEDENINHREIYEGNTKYFNTAIKIDTLKKYLNKLVKAGANYVSIHYHTDHVEYELDGQLITLATQEEIDEYDEKENDYKKKYFQERLLKIEKDRKFVEDSLKKMEENENKHSG
jgi:hypothetical protein